MKNEKESYETLHIKRYFLSNCLVSEMINLCFMRKNDEKSIIYYCSSLKCKNVNGFMYQTLPLMGATRPASGHFFSNLVPRENAMSIHLKKMVRCFDTFLS